MIEIKNLSVFTVDSLQVGPIHCTIDQGTFFGLLGANGSGKSTLLRLIAGVCRAHSGVVLIEGKEVFDNPEAKKHIFFVSDAPFFFSRTTIDDMAEFYQKFYEDFDHARLTALCKAFSLNEKQYLTRFSRGIRRQAAMILALASQAPILLFDQTLDELDPFMRTKMLHLLNDEVRERKTTVVVASHHGREMVAICDRVGVINEKGIRTDQEILKETQGIFVVRAVFEQPREQTQIRAFPIYSEEWDGHFVKMLVEGSRDKLLDALEGDHAVYKEVRPARLDEILESRGKLL